jgi:thymidine phosphorylase
MDWEIWMDETYEMCRALDALEHARQVMAFHAQGYHQVATLAGLALERIEAVRGSQNWVQLQETMHEVEAILNSILLQATERAENLQECADGYANADPKRR